MATALAGIRVLDLTDSIAGQFCARMLADHGAETLLVEPLSGASMRNAAPLGPDGASLLFFHLNTGKGSTALDRTTAKGLKAFTKLAQATDVAIVDTEADRAALAALAPDVIIAVVSPFGSDGPFANWTGCEMIYQAIGGVMHASGSPDRAPLYGCGDRASFSAGAAAYSAVLAALYAKGRWGIAQAVSVDIAETAAAMANPYVTGYLYNGLLEPRGDRKTPVGQLRCPDGWVGFYLHLHLFAGMCEALGLPDLAEDPRFKPPGARLDNWHAFVALVQAHVAAWRADDVLAILQSVRVVAARSYRLTELRDDCPHLAERGFWEQVPTETGPRTILGPAFRFSATSRSIQAGAPALSSAKAVFSSPRRAYPSPAALTPGILPLAGLRVVELTTAWAGPMAGRILAWLGAEVIHVESASRLDSWRQHNQVFSRYRFPPDGAGDRPWDRTALFNSQNANKLSLALELKDPAGHAAMLKLMAESDVVLCNFTAGTLSRMGFGYARLAELNPAIIVTEMPAFGSTGAMANGTAIGPSMEMAAGMAGMIGYRGGPPTTTGPTYLDPMGALNGAAAILTALLHRQATGAGQHIDISQVEAAMQFIGPQILHALATGENPVPSGNRVAWAAPHDAFQAAGEDQWIAIAATSDTAWAALAEIIGMNPDPRFADLAGRKAHEDMIAVAIAGWARHQDKHVAAALLQQHGIAAAAVHDPRDGATSAYLHHRGYFTPLVHSDIGPVIQEGLPFHLSLTPGHDRFAAPVLGEHTRHVLADIIKLPPDEIADLDARGMTSPVPK